MSFSSANSAKSKSSSISDDLKAAQLVNQRKAQIYLKLNKPIPDKYIETVDDILEEIDELKQELNIGDANSVKQELIKTRNELRELKQTKDSTTYSQSHPSSTR
jgi:hypothetical protein